jgi:hypothetical protein
VNLCRNPKPVISVANFFSICLVSFWPFSFVPYSFVSFSIHLFHVSFMIKQHDCDEVEICKNASFSLVMSFCPHVTTWKPLSGY